MTIRGGFREVSLPAYGSQDVGISPGGAMDQFALECGNALLGNPHDSGALEMLIPPVLTVKIPVLIALTGAFLPKTLMKKDRKSTLLQIGAVYLAEPGSRLHFGSTKAGLRSYLCFRDAETVRSTADLVGRNLQGLDDLFGWTDQRGLIRVVDGPEASLLDDPNAFFSTPWRIGAETNDMGMRLISAVTLRAKTDDMISEAVTTGTIQLTPNGPIVLLRYRQTVGGYPRIFSVISADTDLLAQCSPGQTLTFGKVGIEEAWRHARLKAEAVASLRGRFSL